MIRVVILGSGKGTNARALLQAQQNGELGLAEIVGIFSDNPTAPILKLGPRYDISAFYLKPGDYKTKLTGEAEQHWIDTIQALVPDVIVLAGFMRVLKKPFLKAFPRIVNLHPSLLPAYPGLNSIQRALEAGEKQTGCTVHRVTADVDAGDVIDQATVNIDPADTLESLEAKVHDAEHKLLPKVVKNLARELYLDAVARTQDVK